MADFALEDKKTTSNSIEETPFFFGRGNFGVVHRPRGRGLPGWVVCNPFGKERDRTNRLFFEWARFLAAAGHWALRFDYRGTGDSIGTFEDYSVHDYVVDTERAVAELERISGIPCRGAIGLRLGANLAAIFAAKSGRSLELVMWEPVADGGRYRNSLLRTAMANEMVVSKRSHRSRDDFRRELVAGRSVSVDGFSLAAPMYDSLQTVDSAALGRPTSAPILIVQMKAGRGRAPAPAVSKLYGIYSEGGLARLESVQASPVWMETRSFRWPPDELFGKTLGWIEEREPPPFTARNPVGPASSSCTNGTSTERPVGFEVEGEKVWGILHETAEPREGVSNIVMVAAGDVCRAGFFYPLLARNLAERGWNVLRFDPRGLGDSHGDPGCDLLVEFFGKVENGVLVPDTVAAIDFMERECGSRMSVLIGLCGGAITSVFTAQLDDRVAGIAPLDLPISLFRQAMWDQQEVSWIEVFSQRRSTLFLIKMYQLCHLLKQAGSRIGKSVVSGLCGWKVNAVGNRAWYAERLGENANIPLIVAMERLLERETAVCCVFAGSTEHLRNFELALPGFHAGQPQSDNLLDHRVIQGADHNFVLPGCTEELIASLTKWLEDPRMPWAREAYARVNYREPAN